MKQGFINGKTESSMHTSTPVIRGGGGGGGGWRGLKWMGGGLEGGWSGWVGAGVDGRGSYIKDTLVAMNENCSTVTHIINALV